MTILERYQNIKSKNRSNPIFKFTTEGDTIVARFLARRIDVQTAMGVGNVLDVDITESTSGETGIRSIFESGDLTKIFNGRALESGDLFVLKYDKTSMKGYKSFAFQLLDADGNAVGDNGDDSIPF